MRTRFTLQPGARPRHATRPSPGGKEVHAGSRLDVKEVATWE
ncbi:MAG: hypothetical protein QF819_03135 [Gemmatimonadota bacterium]|nr:hypothetical protein [Gemmatimonadota bacterium]MDP6802154.1 hypothetical protein [Gemmatimonadota bacterium]MDP7032089.1 hypothetical protein [Gemmatimonadota bacterium]